MNQIAKPVAPRRAFEVKISVSGDTWPDLMRSLRQIANHVEEYGAACSMASGGYSSGYAITSMVDETITHDQFATALDNYLDAINAWEKAKARANDEPIADGNALAFALLERFTVEGWNPRIGLDDNGELFMTAKRGPDNAAFLIPDRGAVNACVEQLQDSFERAERRRAEREVKP